jgi:hypothetical protein
VTGYQPIVAGRSAVWTSSCTPVPSRRRQCRGEEEAAGSEYEVCSGSVRPCRPRSEGGASTGGGLSATGVPSDMFIVRLFRPDTPAPRPAGRACNGAGSCRSGMPSAGQRVSAVSTASRTRSAAMAKSPVSGTSAAASRPACSRTTRASSVCDGRVIPRRVGSPRPGSPAMSGASGCWLRQVGDAGEVIRTGRLLCRGFGAGLPAGSRTRSSSRMCGTSAPGSTPSRGGGCSPRMSAKRLHQRAGVSHVRAGGDGIVPDRVSCPTRRSERQADKARTHWVFSACMVGQRPAAARHPVMPPIARGGATVPPDQVHAAQ